MAKGIEVDTETIRNLAGMVETAYLAVDDRRALASPPQSTGGAANRAEAAALKAAAGTAKAKKGITEALNRDGRPPAGLEGTAKYFKVQFNPAQLRLESTATREKKAGIQNLPDGKGCAITSAVVVKPKVVLSLQLYFNELNKADAFAADKFRADAPSLLARDKPRTVQPQIETLIGAAWSSYTRLVTFYWSDFAFQGSLICVDTKYTMFSPSGRPIRAVVGLSIQQEGDDTKLKNWYDDFTKSFGSSKSLVKTGQKVEGLLNLKL